MGLVGQDLGNGVYFIHLSWELPHADLAFGLKSGLWSLAIKPITIHSAPPFGFGRNFG